LAISHAPASFGDGGHTRRTRTPPPSGPCGSTGAREHQRTRSNETHAHTPTPPHPQTPKPSSRVRAF
jgi:hypothetical protein